MAHSFEKLRIGNMTARNRIVRSATAESLATEEGRPTRELAELYATLACGGVGTIITGYAYVRPDGKPSAGALGLYDDRFLDDYRALASAAHSGGARIVLQLVYGGSKSKLASDDPRRIEQLREGAPNVRVLGASAVENPRTHLIPTKATANELAVLADVFGDAAERAKACGFDGVEIHAAHGYLLSQFMSRRFNKRRDVYGGSLGNRVRMARECVEAARAAVGSGFPVLAKLNAWDVLDDPLGKAGGLGREESAQVAAWLVEAGASAIDVSGDWHAASSVSVGGKPYFADFGARLAAELPVPVIVTGGWRDIATIETHLQHDGIAGVAMSRPLICEPDLVTRWQAGDDRPSACTGCGYCQRHVGIPCLLRHAGMA